MSTQTFTQEAELFPGTHSLCSRLTNGPRIQKKHEDCFPRISDATGALVIESLRSRSEALYWLSQYEGAYISPAEAAAVHAHMDGLIGEGEFRVSPDDQHEAEASSSVPRHQGKGKGQWFDCGLYAPLTEQEYVDWKNFARI